MKTFKQYIKEVFLDTGSLTSWNAQNIKKAFSKSLKYIRNNEEVPKELIDEIKKSYTYSGWFYIETMKDKNDKEIPKEIITTIGKDINTIYQTVFFCIKYNKKIPKKFVDKMKENPIILKNFINYLKAYGKEITVNDVLQNNEDLLVYL